MENLTLCEVCVCAPVCGRLNAMGPICECESFYGANNCPNDFVPQLVHGMWVRKTVKDRPGIDEVCCSRCMNVIGVVFSDTGFEECKSGMNFCNKCGAKMDAEGF